MHMPVKRENIVAERSSHAVVHPLDQEQIEETPGCTASLVVFKTAPQMLHDLLQSLPSSVFTTVIDNSPTPVLQSTVSEIPRAAYHFTGQNLGYGKGHNLGLSLSPPSAFHLIVNPDIIINPGTLEQMLCYMMQHPDIGILAPKLLHDDGSIQYLNRRYPAVLDLVLRHMPPGLLTKRMIRRLHDHEMRDTGYDAVCDVECISGALMLCKRAALESVGGFDPGYFMYCEDFDLCRALQRQGMRTVCYPDASAVHLWTRASSKESYMTFVHIQSMLRFFNKWGWKWI